MTNQPTWKVIANLGDTDPVSYGGYFVMVDTTGVYVPEAELIEPPCDEVNLEDPEARWTIYRFCLEPHTYINGVLSDNKYHPERAARYAHRICGVAECVDTLVEEFIAALTGDDPIAKASAYRELVMYFGPDEFDDYPLELTYQEVVERTDRYLSELRT